MVQAAHAVLLELVHVLGEYRGGIALVGGWVHSLHAGDEVYVIGDLTAQREGEESINVVRPWELPYGRFMLGYLNALFRRPWDITGVIKFNAILKFGFLPHIFLVCDGDEKAAKAAMFHGWKRQAAIGMCMLLSAAGLWLYLDWVLPR